MEPQERFIMKKISKRREDMKKKIVQVEKSSTKEPVDIKIQQVTKQEVLPDEGLTFFIMGGEECSDFQGLNQTKDQRLKNDGYEKHAALSNLQNFMDMDDEKITEKVIFPDLLEITCSEYEDDQIRIEKEQEYIFVPSSSPVINRDKLPKNMIPRILEDEGFYIKKKPEAYKRTCNKMENRLLILEEGKCWFEESGEIISLPSPIKQSWNFRKLITVETLNPGLKTIYKKAIKSDIESCFRSKIEGQREMCQLDLNVSMLQFSHHPLFNQEQVLCSRLLQLYECFQNRQQQNIPHLLYEKLKALTKVASDNLKINQLTKKSLQDYNWQISNTKQLYDLEQKKNMSLLHSMLKTWKQIKVLRQRQGFISTPIKLQFQRLKMNIVDEQEELTKVSETETKSKGEDCKNGEKQEDLSYLTSQFEETEFERIKQPTLIPHLSLTAEVTNLYKCSLHEQRRRARVQKLKYFIKIFYNDKQVSCTSASPLQLDFKVMFQQIFNIQLINWPETIRLEVYEISKRTSILAKIYLPIPSNTALKSKAVLEQAEFSCDKLAVPACGEVGSNVPFLLDVTGKEELCLLTSGKLSYSLSWALDKNGIPLTPMSQSLSSVCHSMLRNVDARGVPGIPWLINTQKLFQWADEVRIDPNDPDYSDLMEFIMYTRHKGQAIPKYFRLEQLQEEFNFVSEEEIKKNKRFQLLQLRNAGQLDVSVLQQMPLYDREIPDLVFQEYESQIEKDIQISDVNSITSQRIHSINFMKKIRKLVMKKIVKVNKFNLSDVVTDYEEIVSASQLKHAICQLVERRRNLKPQRRERKKVAAQTIGDGDIHLLVRILRAYNIPSRKPALSRSPGHDYSFSNLSKIKDNIYVNIFDETVIEKHEISGTFQVNIPPLLLGYTWSKTYVSPKEDYNGQNLKECTFLNIFATIEPQISSVISNTESDKFTDEPDITLLQRAQIFRKDCEAIFPNRRIITTVFNDEGANILVTRYIRALNPPKQLLDLFLSDSNATLDIIARFVSLIPCLPDTLNENDGFDIWMSPEHCINLTIGNKEEHAILLCNYFLYFGKKAWVLLGTSTLEGQVAYVLTQETDEYLLWNPLTGQSHKQFDPFCPLQSADCLFDNENVWFNIQHNSTPMSVHFDNSRESSWKQLLPKNIQIQWMKSETAQPKEILYFDTNKSMVEDLKNRIERTLKCKLMEWRPKQPTRWNRQCTAILRQILPKLELGTGSLVSIEDESEFERLLQFYWVSGFPIQLPYTDLQSITNAVYQTGIHSSEFPQTEFALAVYIHAYPNNILSIWIYLASLVRHQ
uniref:Protein CC2D2B isoform X4 n=1 Tax=Phascolarctos cinereus TaxID=38626 RepID=A0A6P5L6X8_PHACI|nr:protein CC2D2B isoform X4 [Phascolarctos cinereus]